MIFYPNDQLFLVKSNVKHFDNPSSDSEATLPRYLYQSGRSVTGKSFSQASAWCLVSWPVVVGEGRDHCGLCLGLVPGHHVCHCHNFVVGGLS